MLGARLAATTDAAIVAPGMTAAHYAPAAYLRIDAQSLAQDEYGLDFGGQLSAHAPAGRIVCDLSPAGDMIEAAANLFAALRDIDVRGLTKIAVAPIPDEGIGEAINDRLQRAAVR
jgi:L-threonylcarbamoyladenylate synthase